MVSINLGEFMLNLFKSKRLLSSTLLASVLAGSLITSGCTNPTSTAGKVSYFTEGVITDVEYITIDLDHYNTKNSAIVGGAIGAAAGQIIGGNTKGTLIGAGIGALLSGVGSKVMDRTTDGARLTINTNQGFILVDQPFSCYYKKGSKVRLINQNDNTVQVQVYYEGSYRTAEKNAHKDCKL